MQIFKVGGWVRDTLLGLTPHDCDYVVVGSTPEELLNLGFKPVGKDFPVFLHPQTNEEYALARTERKIAIGYKGFSFYTAPTITLEEDLKRRDITINAIAMDLNGNLFDPFNGVKDLHNRKIRHISNSFIEDPLRIIRVARFASQLNFTIVKSTIKLMQKIAHELPSLSQERIHNELYKAFKSQNPIIFLNALFASKSLYIVNKKLSKIWQNRNFRSLILRVFHSCPQLEDRLIIIGFYTNLPQDYLNLLDKSTSSLAQKLLKHYEDILNLHNLSPSKILQLINQLDAKRNHNKFLQILRLFKIIAKEQQDNLVNQTSILQAIHNSNFLYTISIELNQLDWNKICNHKLEVKDKVKYFQQYQLDIINNKLGEINVK